MEQTLAIFKPDCIQRRLLGKVITRIEDNNFRILGLKMIKLDTKTAQSFYQVHTGKSFFEGLVEFMTSGPCCVAVLEKDNAIEDYRKLMGNTNPVEADEGTIRKEFAENTRRNIVHGSDSSETAKGEIAFFYSIQEFLTFS